MSPDYVLEPEKDSDAEEVIAFFNRLGGETDYISFGENEYAPKTPEEHKEYQKGRITVVARSKIDGKIAGHGFVLPNQRRCSHVYYFGVAVLKAHWRKGIGSAIMHHVCEKAIEAGAEKITLNVDPENKGAVKCYENYGFQIEGCLKKEFKVSDEKYCDSLVMSKWVGK